MGRRFGRYELTSRLGHGGMGEVWVANDTSMNNREVVVKLLQPHLAENSQFRERFNREASQLAHFQHPNIVVVHTYGDIDNVLYIEMPKLPGRDLATVIRLDGPRTLAQTQHLIRQVAKALDAAHRNNLIHRDIKPANIFVSPSNHVSVIDFGIAYVDGQESKTKGTLGTAQYMAPERLDGVSTRSVDIYALACVAFECLTGRAPFEGNAAQQAIAHMKAARPKATAHGRGISSWVDAVIAKGMAIDPAKRYESAGEFATALENTVGHPGSTAAVDGGARKRGPIVAAAVLVALVAAAGVTAFALTRPEGPNPGLAFSGHYSLTYTTETVDGQPSDREPFSAEWDVRTSCASDTSDCIASITSTATDGTSSNYLADYSAGTWKAIATANRTGCTNNLTDEKFDYPSWTTWNFTTNDEGLSGGSEGFGGGACTSSSVRSLEGKRTGDAAPEALFASLDLIDSPSLMTRNPIPEGSYQRKIAWREDPSSESSNPDNVDIRVKQVEICMRDGSKCATAQLDSDESLLNLYAFDGGSWVVDQANYPAKCYTAEDSPVGRRDIYEQIFAKDNDASTFTGTRKITMSGPCSYTLIGDVTLTRIGD